MKKLLLGLMMLFAFTYSFAQFEGTWKMAPQAAALGVGPSQGSMIYWSNSLADVTTRACFFDDQYVFNADGSFNNVMDASTWVEGWQGVSPDQCSTPVYPHNGSNPATWAYDSGLGTLTLTGTGAFMGIPKAANGFELTAPSQAPAAITYLVTVINGASMTLDIDVGGNWWRFLLEKQAAAGSDASLSDLQVDGSTISGFLPNITNYTYGLVEGTVTVPQVTSATPTDPSATSVVITQSPSVPGDATVVVTAADGTTTMTYTVSMAITIPNSTPPVPTQNQSDVISIYSDSYANLPGVDYNPWWWQSTTVTVDEVVAGNNTLLYENLNYQGTSWESTPQDVSLYDFVHVDFWTVSTTPLKFYVISPGNETPYTLPSTTGSWESVDIPLSTYVPPVDLSNVIQFKVEGSGTVWLDNLYFWKYPPTSGSDATLSDLTVDGSTVNGFSSATLNYDVELPYGTSIVPTVSATTTDVNATFVVNDAASLPGTTSVVVTAQDGTTTLSYNVNFIIAGIAPTIGAPTPPQAASNVLSIYSDSYTDLAGTLFNPWWNQTTTVAVVNIAGNNAMRYRHLNYQGTQFASPQDVSGYEYLHVDFWTSNATALNFFIIDQSPGEVSYSLPITAEQWVSVDIPLSHYSNGGENLADILQFKVDGGDGSTTEVWFDNWYFWKPASTTWTGAVDNSWNNAANWDNGVPNAYTDATIPAGLTNYPTISAAAECNSVTLGANASGYATLLDGGNLTVHGSANIESYLSGNVWHFVGSPVTGATAYDVFHMPATGYNVYLQSFDETTNKYTDVVNATLKPMEGYAAWVDGGSSTFTYSGSLNTGAFGSTNNMTRTIPGDNGGNNLIANPYPSGLNWDIVKTTNANMMDAYYVENNGAWATYVAGVGLGTNGVIAPGQGFFAFVSDDGSSNGTVIMDNTARVHSGAPFLKDAVANLVRLKAQGNNKSDETVVRFLDEATPLFDEQFDAFKLSAFDEDIPQIYSICNKDLAINTLPQTDQVQLGFTANVDGEYTISATEINDLSEVWLEDSFNNEFTNLLTNSYTFNYSIGENAERFILHFGALAVTENMDQLISIYSAKHIVHIDLPAQSEAQMQIYNSLGQEILTSSLKAMKNSITLDKAGIYIVKINIDNQQVSEKILIK